MALSLEERSPSHAGLARSSSRRGLRVVPKPDEAGAAEGAQETFTRNLEMLRCLGQGLGVSETAIRFGLSRQTVYNVVRAYSEVGIEGLLPRKSGPRGAFKCKAEVVDFVLRCKEREPKLSLRVLVQRVARAFGLELHPNTLRYALAKRSRLRT